MKRALIVITIIFIIIVLYLICRYDSSKFFEKEKIITYSLNDTFIEQKEIDKKIEMYSKDKTISIDNPVIINNPYQISPLTSLIIFYTQNKTNVTLNVNNEYETKFKESNTHIIPVYGLYENKDNNIKIILSDGREKNITIKTSKSENVNNLKVINNKNNDSKELYFMTSPVGTSASAYDKDGNLKWYLTQDYVMDFEWLPNNHFLVGLAESSVNDRKIGFVEMDYLGKIYNYYTSKYGYEFEFQILSNGNYMLCGGDEPIFYDKPYIYEMNPKNGNIESYLDIYQIFKDIDENFDDTKLNYKIIRNAFSYNEKTNEIVLSLRGLNSVVSINYKTKKINYIFAPEGVYSEKFDKYMVKLNSGRYPLGLHSVFLTKENYVGFINNGYDRLHGHEVGENNIVSSYKNNYTSAEIYKIDNMEATLMWEYNANKKFFAHQYGSFSINNGNKLINYGWVLHDSYRKNKNALLSESEKTTENSHSIIFEFDKDNNMILNASIEDGKYRVFKHLLYNDETSNLDYTHGKAINTIPTTDMQIIYTKKIEKQLLNSKDFKNNIRYTKNSIDTDYTFDTLDEVSIVLVGENNYSYIINYKEENCNPNKLLNIDLNKGKYALYLRINNIYYNTNLVVKY